MRLLEEQLNTGLIRMDMDKETVKKPMFNWDYYFICGLAVAMMLPKVGIPFDGFYQVVVVLLFFVFTGAKQNATLLWGFAKHHFILCTVTIVWLLHFGWILEGTDASARLALGVFSVIFAGYCIIARCEDLPLAFERLWLIMMTLCGIGFIKYFIFEHGTQGTYFLFLEKEPEAIAALVLALFSLFFVTDLWKRVVGFVLAMAVIICTGQGVCAIAALVGLVVCIYENRKQLKGGYLKEYQQDKRFVILCTAFCSALLVLFLFYIWREDIMNILNSHRLNGLFFAPVGAEESFIDNYLNIIAGTMNGRGPAERLQGIGALYADSEGAVLSSIRGDNSLFGLLMCYGWIAVLLYLVMIIRTIKKAVMAPSGITGNYSKCLAIISIAHIFVQKSAWVNVCFFLSLLIGIWLYLADNGSEANNEESEL